MGTPLKTKWHWTIFIFNWKYIIFIHGGFFSVMLVFGGNLMALHTRWAPTSYKWSYNPYKWPYKWGTGVITVLIGVITPVISGRGPPCTPLFIRKLVALKKPWVAGPCPDHRRHRPRCGRRGRARPWGRKKWCFLENMGVSKNRG